MISASKILAVVAFLHHSINSVTACEGACITETTAVWVGNYSVNHINPMFSALSESIHSNILSNRPLSEVRDLIDPIASNWNDGIYRATQKAIFPDFFHGKCQRVIDGVYKLPDGCPKSWCPVVCGTPGSMVFFYDNLVDIVHRAMEASLDVSLPISGTVYDALEQAVISLAKTSGRRSVGSVRSGKPTSVSTIPLDALDDDVPQNNPGSVKATDIFMNIIPAPSSTSSNTVSSEQTSEISGLNRRSTILSGLLEFLSMKPVDSPVSNSPTGNTTPNLRKRVEKSALPSNLRSYTGSGQTRDVFNEGQGDSQSSSAIPNNGSLENSPPVDVSSLPLTPEESMPEPSKPADKNSSSADGASHIVKRSLPLDSLDAPTTNSLPADVLPETETINLPLEQGATAEHTTSIASDEPSRLNDKEGMDTLRATTLNHLDGAKDANSSLNTDGAALSGISKSLSRKLRFRSLAPVTPNQTTTMLEDSVNDNSTTNQGDDLDREEFPQRDDLPGGEDVDSNDPSNELPDAQNLHRNESESLVRRDQGLGLLNLSSLKKSIASDPVRSKKRLHQLTDIEIRQELKDIISGIVRSLTARCGPKLKNCRWEESMKEFILTFP